MVKTATFTWTVTVEVRDDFDKENPKHLSQALHDAWMEVHESRGELTDENEEDC